MSGGSHNCHQPTALGICPMSATANVLTSRPAVSGAERSVPLTQATNILDWAATAPSFSAASPMSSRGQLGSAFNPPTGPSQASHPSQGGTLLPSDGSPPPGRAAFDYYTAQSDYIQSMMQSQAHASRITPHIIIKGQGQPVQTLQGHSQYPPGMLYLPSSSNFGMCAAALRLFTVELKLRHNAYATHGMYCVPSMVHLHLISAFSSQCSHHTGMSIEIIVR